MNIEQINRNEDIADSERSIHFHTERKQNRTYNPEKRYLSSIHSIFSIFDPLESS